MKDVDISAIKLWLNSPGMHRGSMGNVYTAQLLEAYEALKAAAVKFRSAIANDPELAHTTYAMAEAEAEFDAFMEALSK